MGLQVQERHTVLKKLQYRWLVTSMKYNKEQLKEKAIEF